MAPSTDNSLLLSPQRNVTFAVNYELSLVDRFWQSDNAGKKQNSSLVASVPSSTSVNLIPVSNGATKPTTRSSNGINENAPNDASSLQSPETVKATVNPLSDEDSSGSGKENKKKLVTIKSPMQRRSTREMKKKQVPVERTRVRYDMELVPAIKRNRSFLDKFPLWAAPAAKREDSIKAILFKQQQALKEQEPSQGVKKFQQEVAQKQPQSEKLEKEPKLLGDQKQKKLRKLSEQQQRTDLVVSSTLRDQEQVNMATLLVTSSDTKNMALKVAQEVDDISPHLVPDEEQLSPFAEDASVVWVPKTRSEWEDSVLEMTAVCTSAAMRRHMATRGRSTSSKPFHAPLSKEYIRDRVDIDDPLNGYQIRHKKGGWLQGFILWTNFTTWTHYFKWDSSHAMSGIPTMNSGSNTSLVDADGSLANELERQPRSGDPFGGGVVFEAVAEISLVGGLGCGEYLLRMALECIRVARTYKFVVLQATDTSKTFYERYGFVRVGAICRYERKDKEAGKPGARPDTPIMGYRHWTHPNESDTSLQKHGGPSYMMCLRLPGFDDDDIIQTPFLDAMMKLEVKQKPTIEQLGGSSTPNPKLLKKEKLDGELSDPPNDALLTRNAPKRRFGRGHRGSNESPNAQSFSSMPQPFNSSGMTPPVLPVLTGSTLPNNPASNNGCAIAPVQEKISLRSSGVKRTVEAGAVPGARSTKKRRLMTTGDVTAVVDNTESQLTSNEGRSPAEAYPRRTSRMSACQTPATTAVLPASSADAKVASFTPPANSQTASELSSPKKRSALKRTPRRTPPVPVPTPSTSEMSEPTATEQPCDTSKVGPLKQKVKSYPRDRVHFYNKVVRPKKGEKSENYFVLHYDERKGTIRIIPMEPRGVLSGKRAGRPRFQAVMANFDREVKTVRCTDYDVVKAFMVMKTPVVASEAWDVLDA